LESVPLLNMRQNEHGPKCPNYETK
jgi:hypothetical protein